MPSPRRAFLHLVTCVAIALGLALCEVWGLGPRHRRGLPRVEFQLDLVRLEAQIRILSAWFRRGKRRPRYSRREVLLILEHRERWGLSATEVARKFLVSSATVYRGLYRRREGSLEKAADKPVPPCRRIADSRRLLVAEMALAGFEGDRTIERHLHLQGEKISARSVRRFRQNPLGPSEEGKTRRQKRAKEIPDLVHACAGEAASRDDVGRPRMARLLRALAEAFAEGIAADTLRRLDEGSVSEVEHARLRSRRTEQLAILHGRFRRIPPRHRPRYTSTERAEILALKHRFRLSNKTLAGWFLLDPDTLCDWNRDVDHPEERQRPLVEPIADLEAAVSRVALPPRCRGGSKEGSWTPSPPSP